VSVKTRAIYVVSVTAFFLGLLVFLMAIFKANNSFWRKKISRFILIFARAKPEVFGEPHLETTLFVLNHKSMMDIMILESVAKQHDIAWVAKKELFKIKFYGYLLKASKMISIDRETKRSIVQLIRDSEDRLKDGRTIAIFPEGTRYVENGLLPFKTGASIVANRFRLRVQPVVIRNSNKIFDSTNFTSEKSKVFVEFLPSFIATSETDWLEETREKMLKVLAKDSE
jgi:1-acyl-sn-glycerol-3-phosphate acyltransferase